MKKILAVLFFASFASHSAPLMQCHAVLDSAEGKIVSNFKTTVGKGSRDEFDSVKDTGSDYVYDVQGSEDIAGTRLTVQKDDLKGIIAVLNVDGDEVAGGDVSCKKI